MNSVKDGRGKDLGVRLLALYLLFVTPVALAALVFSALADARLRSDVRAADLSLAQAVAQETDAMLQNAMQTVSQFAREPAVIHANHSAMQHMFADAARARNDINLFYLLDDKGVMAFHYPVGPGSTVGVDFSFRDYYRTAIAGDHPVISWGRISPTTQRPVATAAMRVLDEDERLVGVVATNLELQQLSKTLAAIVERADLPSQGLQVSIIDARGQLVAHADPARLLQDLSRVPGVADVLAGRSDSRAVRDEGGAEWLRSFVPIKSAGWGVIVERPGAVAFATPRALQQGVYVALAIFFVGGLLFWLALSYRVIHPLETLATFSHVVGSQAWLDQTQHAAPPFANSPIRHVAAQDDQIGRLARSLQRMEQDIQHRFAELSTLLETSKAVVSTLDTEQVINSILDQVQRLLGVTMCAVVAQDAETGVFSVRASRGLGLAYAQDLHILPTDVRSPTRQAIASGRPVQVPDVETADISPRTQARAHQEGYRAILAVPLIAQHAGQGALLIYQRQPHTFTPREIDLAWNFANHAAMAIENATLYARTDERLREQKSMLDAIMQSMTDGLILESLTGQVLYANRRVSELTGLLPDQLVGRDVSAVREDILVSVGDPDAYRRSIRAALDGSGPRQFEFTLRREDSAREIRLCVFDVQDQAGHAIGRGKLWQDVTRDREIERAKSALLSAVSHELRTPLAAIKGYATTLLADDVEWDAASQREFLHVISAETDRLTLLVTELLDVSRIEAGTLMIDRQASRLPDIVRQAMDASATTPAALGAIHLDVPDDLPLVYVDARRIQVVIRNLVENALKYTPVGTPIAISARAEDGQVEVHVADRGPGIAPPHRPYIFDRFYRADQAVRARGGSGLGLAICKGFIEAHGGRIWLASGDAGADFAFTLPIVDPSSVQRD